MSSSYAQAEAAAAASPWTRAASAALTAGMQGTGASGVGGGRGVRACCKSCMW